MAAALLSGEGRTQLSAAHPSVEGVSRQYAKSFAGSSNASALAAVERSAQALERLDTALSLLARSADDLHAYMRDVLGPGSISTVADGGPGPTDRAYAQSPHSARVVR